MNYLIDTDWVIDHLDGDPSALDLLVAATAFTHHLTLVTRNTQDHADIPGLQTL